MLPGGRKRGSVRKLTTTHLVGIKRGGEICRPASAGREDRDKNTGRKMMKEERKGTKVCDKIRKGEKGGFVVKSAENGGVRVGGETLSRG